MVPACPTQALAPCSYAHVLLRQRAGLTKGRNSALRTPIPSEDTYLKVLGNVLLLVNLTHGDDQSMAKGMARWLVSSSVAEDSLPEQDQLQLDDRCVLLVCAAHVACRRWQDCWTGGLPGTAGSDRLVQQSSGPCSLLQNQETPMNTISMCSYAVALFVLE